MAGCERILVVDDNPVVVSLLGHALAGAGYRVHSAPDGEEALRSVADDPPDLIFLDVDMPRLTGDETCRRLKRDPATRAIPVVMLTGSGGADNKIAAWEYGADEFLTKPFQLAEVTSRCRSLLRIKRLVEERDSAEAVVFALARTVEAKSRFTHGHSERVTAYARHLAEYLELAEGERETLRKGGLLHDLGKISIPDAVLDKPGSLTDEEFALVRAHPEQGVHILDPLRSLADTLPLIRWHHERMDGRGYPDGLRGDEIPLLVRLLAVCDVFDSLASDRPYRARLTRAECLRILDESAAGGGLDPKMVVAFAAMLQQFPTPAALGLRPSPSVW